MSSKDSEDIIPTGDNKSTDLNPVVYGMFSSIPIKQMLFIFIIFIFLSSDVFISRMLQSVDGAVGYNGSPTSKGTIIVGVILVLLYMVADILIKKNIV